MFRPSKRIETGTTQTKRPTDPKTQEEEVAKIVPVTKYLEEEDEEEEELARGEIVIAGAIRRVLCLVKSPHGLFLSLRS